MSKLEQQEFQQRISRIEELIHDLEVIADPNARAAAQELVQALLELHGAGLERMLDIAHDAAGQEIIDDLAQDALVGSLLLLHDLHPLRLETRVMQALDKVRPALGLHGGNVELISVSDDGTVKLRLQGNCHGCPSSQATLRNSIEESIYAAAPDVITIEVIGEMETQPAQQPNFIPMSQLLGHEPVLHGRAPDN